MSRWSDTNDAAGLGTLASGRLHAESIGDMALQGKKFVDICRHSFIKVPEYLTCAYV